MSLYTATHTADIPAITTAAIPAVAIIVVKAAPNPTVPAVKPAKAFVPIPILELNPRIPIAAFFVNV